MIGIHAKPGIFILTFEKGDLAPSLGYAFDPACLDPYESLVCMLCKFAWMNRLPGHIVARHAVKSAVDPYDDLSASLGEINVARIAAGLHVSRKMLRAATRHPDSRRQ